MIPPGHIWEHQSCGLVVRHDVGLQSRGMDGIGAQHGQYGDEHERHRKDRAFGVPIYGPEGATGVGWTAVYHRNLLIYSTVVSSCKSLKSLNLVLELGYFPKSQICFVFNDLRFSSTRSSPP